MEAKVHEELLTFLAQHSLEETMSNIDDIVLSYLVGVVELASQGDDGLDIVELMEMMNAYLPGFDQIGRSHVIDWMFGLASKLIGKDTNQKSNCNQKLSLQGDDKGEVILEDDGMQELPSKEKKFPTYDYTNKTVCENSRKEICVSDQHYSNEKQIKHMGSCAKDSAEKCCGQNNGSVVFISTAVCNQSPQSTFPSPTVNDTHNRHPISKRKGRQLSSSSQDSQDDFCKADDVEESQVKMLLEMFPSACTMEARYCLQLSAGNMDRAAQLIIDRHDTGQAIKDQSKCKSMKKNNKVKKLVEYKLDDDSIKLCVLQKYSFIDTEEDKKTHRPPPPKGEAKKLVRYRDGQVVSMKGEKFSEVKKKDEGEMKSTYVSLKPARKYRFH